MRNLAKEHECHRILFASVRDDEAVANGGNCVRRRSGGRQAYPVTARLINPAKPFPRTDSAMSRP